MKDMLNKRIGVGHHIFYFRSIGGGVVPEEAMVVKINDNSVRIEYIKGERKLKQSNIYKPSKKIFILDRRFSENILLKEENRLLKEDNDKIHYRFDILDL